MQPLPVEQLSLEQAQSRLSQNKTAQRELLRRVNALPPSNVRRSAIAYYKQIGKLTSANTLTQPEYERLLALVDRPTQPIETIPHKQKEVEQTRLIFPATGNRPQTIMAGRQQLAKRQRVEMVQLEHKDLGFVPVPKGYSLTKIGKRAPPLSSTYLAPYQLPKDQRQPSRYKSTKGQVERLPPLPAGKKLRDLPENERVARQAAAKKITRAHADLRKKQRDETPGYAGPKYLPGQRNLAYNAEVGPFITPRVWTVKSLRAGLKKMNPPITRLSKKASLALHFLGPASLGPFSVFHTASEQYRGKTSISDDEVIDFLEFMLSNWQHDHPTLGYARRAVAGAQQLMFQPLPGGFLNPAYNTYVARTLHMQGRPAEYVSRPGAEPFGEGEYGESFAPETMMFEPEEQG